MSRIKVSAFYKPFTAAAMAALTIFASLSFAGCENPLIPIPAETPTVSNAVSEVATPVIPVPGNFSGVAEETSTENTESSLQQTSEVSAENSVESDTQQPPEVSAENSAESGTQQTSEVSAENNVEASSQQTSEVSAENSVESDTQQPEPPSHEGTDESNFKVEDFEILYLKDVSFLTMSAYGSSGNIHKDAYLNLPLVYKDITIPEGTVMNVWGTYSEEEYVLRWYDNLVILPKSALTLTDDPLRNIYMSVGIDESSIMDIHSNPSVALPTKKLAILEDKEIYGNETSCLTLYEGEIIEVFDFNESDTRYLFKNDGHIWSINLANVHFVEPTYGLYTPSGEQPRWVRILEETWVQEEYLTPYEKKYNIQWGGYKKIITGEYISVITENTDVIPTVTSYPSSEFTGEISCEYGILQGTLQVDGKPVPAGTAVQIISIDDSGNTIINWYGSQFLSISDWLVKVDESIGYKEGFFSDKSGKALVTAGILIKGISPSSDFSYISEKYISGI